MYSYDDLHRDSSWRGRLKAAGFRVIECDDPAPQMLRHPPGSNANMVPTPSLMVYGSGGVGRTFFSSRLPPREPFKMPPGRGYRV
jgi:hypothetical protein